ncbi:MAG TPA: PAS domain S-box protein [Desulfomonilia bacterium]|nr:PAS domain S-box protein [Desulfomonilia bacterium]
MNNSPSYEELGKRLKELEEELIITKEKANESEEHYRALFERSFDIIYVHDMKGRFLDASNAMETILGYSKDEVPNLTLRYLLSHDQMSTLLNTLEELKETGTQKKTDQYKVRRKDGSFVWLETRSSILYHDGKPYAVQGIAREISDWMAAQESLKNSYERYRTIFENTGNATVLIREDMTILLVNSNFEKLSGYSRDEIEGKMSWLSFAKEQDLDRLRNYHQSRREKPGSAPESYERCFVTRSGEVRHVLVLVSLIPGSGESVANYIDITERKKAEEAHRVSEEKYRTILESMDESYFEVDLAGNFTFFNNAACRRSGRSPDELLGLNYRSYTTPETAKRMFETFNRVYRTGNPEQMADYQVIHKDRSIHDNEMSVGLMRDSSGKPIGFHVVVRDVTVYKQAEKALRQSEEHYRTIFENTGNATILIAEDTTILLANSNFEILTGYSRQEMEGNMSWTVLIADDDLEMMKRYHYQRRIDPNSAPSSYEFRLKNRKGELRNIFLTLAMIPGTKETLASCVDITERKRAEELLSESEERYRGILENMEEAYYEVDLKGNFSFFNPTPTQRLGYDYDELMGLNFRQYMDEENAKKVFDAYHQVYLTGEPLSSIDWELKSKQGQKIYVEASVSLRRDAGGAPIGFRGVVRDITTKKRAEEALRISEEKYRTILESMDEAYFEADLEGGFTFFNDSLCNVLGYSREELTSMNYKVYSTPEAAGKASQIFNEILKTGTPNTMMDYEIIRKDGAKRVIEASISLIREQSGEAIGFRGVGRDVTERIHAEHALKESEKRYRLLAENLRDVIWVLDTELHYVYVSPSVMQLRGYTPEEAVKQTMDQVLTPESFQRAVDIFTKERLLELSGHTHGKEWTRSLELEMICKDGSTIWTDVTVNILYDDTGAPTGLLGITRDISERRKAAESLRESEKRYRTIFENTGTASILVDGDGTILLVNSNFEKLSGYSRQDIEGKMTWGVFVSPEDRDRMNKFHEMRGVDQDSVPDSYEFSFLNREGGARDIFVNVALIPETKVRVASLMDITDRKQAEEEIKEREAKYRFLTEKMNDVVWTMDLDLRTKYVSPSVVKLLGYTPDERAAQDVGNQLTPESLAAATRILAYELERDGKEGIDPDRTITFEGEYYHKDGSKRWLENRITGIRDNKGNVIGLHGVSRDVTEQRKAAVALRESEERFRDLANLLPETVFETDEAGRLTFVNQSSLERFGYSADEVAGGLSIFDVITRDDHERLIVNYQKIFKGDRIGLNEYTARRKDGSTFPAMIHSTSILRDGKPAGLRGFLIDITEKKNLEHQLVRAQKMEAIGTLAGGIAHDFNNLLMGILGNVSLMLLHFDESHPFFDRLKSVEEYIQRGSDLTKQLLGFARGGKYEVKPTNLGEFVHRSSEMFGRTKKEIRIHRKLADGLWTVEMDRGQMEQVLLNLFVNAWQAMPGGGDLYLSVENVELDEVDVSPYDIKPGRFVKVTVTYTGIGMDESVKARIFEPFFTTKERGRGTGLGLASAYGIIKNHGGLIYVESEKDMGTSFMIYLPASDKAVEEDRRTRGEVLKGQEAVLLIDDEDMILDVGSKMLEGLGYKVMTAPGGRQGLKVYEQNRDKIDLVILDFIMPDFGGKETFDTLHRVNPQVKVLLSSGYSLDGQAKEIMQSGCKGFIQKPFSMAELSKKIREILDSDK